MPYDIVSTPGGYYVVGPSGRKSNAPLALAVAKKQRTAINISKARHSPPPKITMSAPEFISEHRRLIKTLKEGSRAGQAMEAARQAAELRERIG